MHPGKVIDGFQQVRFALCIIALQQDNTWRKIQFQAGIISEVSQAQMEDTHILTDALGVDGIILAIFQQVKAINRKGMRFNWANWACRLDKDWKSLARDKM
jgi:hypothetical protein